MPTPSEPLTPQASNDPRHRGRQPRPFDPPKRPQAIVSVQEKEAIIEAAKTAILEGRHTLKQIAEQHQISHRTLQYWLAQLGEEYETLRHAWIDLLLLDAGEEIEQVGGFDQLNPSEITLSRDEVNVQGLRLARARELWKRATWYAERRDPSRYAPKQEVAIADKRVTVVINRGPARAAVPQLTEPATPPAERHIIDLQAEAP